MTIKEELRQIALACIDSEEFTKRAKCYLKNEKEMQQPLMSDSEFRDFYRGVSAETEREKCWEKYEKYIKRELHKRPDCSGFYYEVWFDLAESFEEMYFSSLRFLDDTQIVEVCAKYLNERSRYYDSPHYIDDLNNELGKLGDK